MYYVVYEISDKQRRQGQHRLDPSNELKERWTHRIDTCTAAAVKQSATAIISLLSAILPLTYYRSPPDAYDRTVYYSYYRSPPDAHDRTVLTTTQLWQDPRSPTHNEVKPSFRTSPSGSSPYTGETSAICRAVFGFAEVDSTVFQTVYRGVTLNTVPAQRPGQSVTVLIQPIGPRVQTPGLTAFLAKKGPACLQLERRI
eukprot:g81456.t1